MAVDGDSVVQGFAGTGQAAAVIGEVAAQKPVDALAGVEEIDAHP
jgi:hypothetical protein